MHHGKFWKISLVPESPSLGFWKVLGNEDPE